jgi:hypothetical protein
MKQSEKHIHKLKKINYKSGNKVFFCTLPDCNFKISVPLSLGKRSLCWRCGIDFIMNEYSLRLAKPHCDSCHRPKDIKIDEKKIILTKVELSLSERLSQTINEANKQSDQEDI